MVSESMHMAGPMYISFSTFIVQFSVYLLKLYIGAYIQIKVHRFAALMHFQSVCTQICPSMQINFIDYNHLKMFQVGDKYSHNIISNGENKSLFKFLDYILNTKILCFMFLCIFNEQEKLQHYHVLLKHLLLMDPWVLASLSTVLVCCCNGIFCG